MPSLLLGGVASPILHVSQLASLLGFQIPSRLEASRLAWDAAAVLESWLELIGRLDLETLLLPTPSRGRSLRNLTVNVFHPFELLPIAFEEGRFDWNPDLDGAREALLEDVDAIAAYASARHVAWQDWLLEHEAELLARDPAVDSPRGSLTYGNLLASQRWHAAFHYRQLLAFLESRGEDLTDALSLSRLGDLNLPPEVY